MTILRFAIHGLCGLSLLVASASAVAQQPPGPPGEDGRQGRTIPNRPGNSKLQQMRSSVGGGDSVKSDFVDLLENEDLSQFRGYKQEEIGDGWSVDGNTLHFSGSGGGDIVTRETYQNFDLTFEWKISEGGNSGVMYRVSLGDNAPYISGPEYQILDDTAHQDGKNPQTSAGALYALYEPRDTKRTRPVGTWNDSRITVEGNNVKHYLNGRLILEADMGSPEWQEKIANSKFKDWEKFGKNESGHIAFQDHGNEVWFRKIKVKQLEATEEGQAAARKRPGNSKIQQMMQSRPGTAGPGGPAEDIGGGNRQQNRTQNSGGNKFKKLQEAGGAPPQAGGGNRGGG